MKRKIFGTKEFYFSALLLTLPVIGQNLIENLVNLLDNFMVAGLGDIKMSGTSVAGQIIFVFMVIINALCMSGGIFVTQYHGANDKDGIHKAIAFKTVISLFILIIFLIVCLIFPKEILNLMLIGNTQAEEIISEGVNYMHIISLAGLPMIICYICSSSLKETGNVKQPLYVAFVAAIVNMIFNYGFIYGHFGLPRLEVMGAALATVLARTLEAVLLLLIIYRSDIPIKMSFKELFIIDPKLFKNMFKKSARIIASEAIWAFTETITTALYNGLGGADVVSGMSASFTIANLYFTSLGGVNVATGVIIGNLLGKGQLDQAREKRTWLASGAVIFSIFVTLIALSTTYLVPIFYSNLSISAQDICTRMVFYMALFMPVWIFLNIQLAISRAGGDVNMAFIIDGLVNLFISIPLVFYLAKATNIGPVGIYTISKFLDIGKVIACYFWLNKERWLVNLTTEQ